MNSWARCVIIKTRIVKRLETRATFAEKEQALEIHFLSCTLSLSASRLASIHYLQASLFTSPFRTRKDAKKCFWGKWIVWWKRMAIAPSITLCQVRPRPSESKIMLRWKTDCSEEDGTKKAPRLLCSFHYRERNKYITCHWYSYSRDTAVDIYSPQSTFLKCKLLRTSFGNGKRRAKEIVWLHPTRNQLFRGFYSFAMSYFFILPRSAFILANQGGRETWCCMCPLRSSYEKK